MYHVPTLKVVKPTNLAANSGKNVTIFGTDFGIWDTKPQARLVRRHWHCNTLQKHCGTPQHVQPQASDKAPLTLQHTATNCNTMQHTATHCNILNTLQHIVTPGVPGKAPFGLPHTAAHCKTHCNTLQHTATHCNPMRA